MIGTSGNDILRGAGGNDVLSGAGGNDLLLGYGGDDFLSGGEDRDRAYGGRGNDRLEGGNGDDLLFGGGGNDSLFGGGGDDLLLDGAGNDRLSGGIGNDFLLGRDGDDSLFGGSGDDSLEDFTGSNSLYGGSGVDQVVGGIGSLLLLGTGDDSSAGGSFVYGGDGNDDISAGPGQEDQEIGTVRLFGEAGNDTLRSASAPYVVLIGGPGNDIFAIGGSTYYDPPLLGAVPGHTVVTDFVHGADRLQIQLDDARLPQGGEDSTLYSQIVFNLIAGDNGVIDDGDPGVTELAAGMRIDFAPALGDVPIVDVFGPARLFLRGITELTSDDFAAF